MSEVSERPAWLTDDLVKQAVTAMDAVTGYSVRLTKMVDEEEEYTAFLPGEAPRVFADREDATLYAQERMEVRRVEAAARAFVAAMSAPDPAVPGLPEDLLAQARGAIDRWLAIEGSAEKLVLAARNAAEGRKIFLNRLSEVADEMDADLARVEPPTAWMRSLAAGKQADADQAQADGASDRPGMLRAAAMARQIADAKETSSRGDLGGMFASQSATDLRAFADRLEREVAGR